MQSRAIPWSSPCWRDGRAGASTHGSKPPKLCRAGEAPPRVSSAIDTKGKNRMADLQDTRKPYVPPEPKERKPRKPYKAVLSLKDLTALNEYWRNGFDASAAGRKAGFKGKHPQAWLRKPAVAAELESRRKNMRKHYDITEDFVMQRLANLADVSIAQVLVKLQQSNYDLSVLTYDEGYAIDKYTEEFYMEGRGDYAREVKKVTVKLSDKLGPLVTMARKLGLLKETVEHTGEVSMVDRIIMARSIEKGPEPLTIDQKPELVMIEDRRVDAAQG